MERFMKVSCTATVFLVLLPVLVLAQTRSEERDPLKGLDEFIKAGMQDTKLPGFALAIVKDDSVIYHQKAMVPVNMATLLPWTNILSSQLGPRPRL